MVIAYTAFVVCASAFDEDLNLAVEGKMQTLFHEELPFTPRRMQLLGLSLLLFSFMLFLAWKLPVMLAIPALVLLIGDFDIDTPVLEAFVAEAGVTI